MEAAAWPCLHGTCSWCLILGRTQERLSTMAGYCWADGAFTRDQSPVCSGVRRQLLALDVSQQLFLAETCLQALKQPPSQSR